MTDLRFCEGRGQASEASLSFFPFIFPPFCPHPPHHFSRFLPFLISYPSHPWSLIVFPSFLPLFLAFPPLLTAKRTQIQTEVWERYKFSKRGMRQSPGRNDISVIIWAQETYLMFVVDGGREEPLALAVPSKSASGCQSKTLFDCKCSCPLNPQFQWMTVIALLMSSYHRKNTC